jgi:hypothetical protein
MAKKDVRVRDLPRGQEVEDLERLSRLGQKDTYYLFRKVKGIEESLRGRDIYIVFANNYNGRPDSSYSEFFVVDEDDFEREFTKEIEVEDTEE